MSSCTLCGSDRKKPFLRSERFTYVRCLDCGLIYQYPKLTLNYLRDEIYTEKYFQYELRNQFNFFNLMDLNIRDLGLEQEIRKLDPDQKRFLDIGSATGMLLNYMKEKEWNVKGIELCEPSAAYAKEKFGVEVINSTLEEACLPESAFEAVHMSHVIEHVPHPPETLREIRRILVPGGLFCIITPNVDSFQFRVFRKRWRSAHPDHLTLFSIKTLSRALQEAGFEIVKQFSYGGLAVGTAPGFIKRLADKSVRKKNRGDVMAFLCKKVEEFKS